MFVFPKPFLVGMIHLPALPGSPEHRLDMGEILERSQHDAATLRRAGFDALMIENFGDVPFSPERLDTASAVAMGVAAWHVRQAAGLPVGINALRNDARSALAIAAAAGASFIRVNVHIGIAATDQGMIEGRADATLRYRRQLGIDAAILADVHVKHATPVSQPDIRLAAEETAYRGLADALIVSGETTGRSVDLEQVKTVKSVVPDRPILVGSGATVETARAILDVCDGVIVGTDLKADRQTDAPIDPQRAAAFVEAARS